MAEKRPRSPNSLCVEAIHVINSVGDGWDPLREQINMARNPVLDPSIRLQALEYVCKRRYPTIKAIEIQLEGEVEHTHKIKKKIKITSDLLEKAEELYRLIAGSDSGKE